MCKMNKIYLILFTILLPIILAFLEGVILTMEINIQIFYIYTKIILKRVVIVRWKSYILNILHFYN